jgi:hypothetical protein
MFQTRKSGVALLAHTQSTLAHAPSTAFDLAGTPTGRITPPPISTGHGAPPLVRCGRSAVVTVRRRGWWSSCGARRNGGVVDGRRCKTNVSTGCHARHLNRAINASPFVATGTLSTSVTDSIGGALCQAGAGTTVTRSSDVWSSIGCVAPRR